jgi:hypothetical protein
MWMVAEGGWKQPFKVLTMQLFDQQDKAEEHANSIGRPWVAYFSAPGEKATKRWGTHLTYKDAVASDGTPIKLPDLTP